MSAIDFAATIMPFTPMVPPAHAVACQLCAGTPGTNVAPVTCTVGTFQLTSARSVDALPTRRVARRLHLLLRAERDRSAVP